MTIQNALNFIRQGQHDNDFRNKLVKAETRQTRQEILNQNDLTFTPEEFEEAYSLTLFKCQEQEDADALMAFRMWWIMLCRSPDADAPST
ncbi:MAG: Nif11-like leader peptide family natural product precursor [Desulfobacterales bacterium]|nr:Nif11-like leader peptide family natural product precursor [Desulfobacterales bacterium]